MIKILLIAITCFFMFVIANGMLYACDIPEIPLKVIDGQEDKPIIENSPGCYNWIEYDFDGRSELDKLNKCMNELLNKTIPKSWITWEPFCIGAKKVNRFQNLIFYPALQTDSDHFFFLFGYNIKTKELYEFITGGPEELKKIFLSEEIALNSIEDYLYFSEFAAVLLNANSNLTLINNSTDFSNEMRKYLTFDNDSTLSSWINIHSPKFEKNNNITSIQFHVIRQSYSSEPRCEIMKIKIKYSDCKIIDYKQDKLFDCSY